MCIRDRLVRVGVFAVHHQYGLLAVINEVVDIVFYKSPCIGGFTVSVSYTHLDVYKRQIDGIINNGPKEDKTAEVKAPERGEKSSIMDLSLIHISRRLKAALPFRRA